MTIKTYVPFIRNGGEGLGVGPTTLVHTEVAKRNWVQSGLLVTEQLERIEDRETIRTLISRSAKYLDDRRYKDFIELFVEKGKYILEAESDEIGQRMIWLETSRDELADLLEESSQHVHDLAERIHLVSMDELTFDNSREDARASSAFSVFRTDTAGVTQIYAGWPLRRQAGVQW